MNNIMNVDPGLVIWTLIIFTIFLIILIKLGAKPIINGLRSREENIKNQIEGAEAANKKATQLLEESQAKLDNAQQEMNDIIADGRKKAEEIINKATEEADKVKRQKVAEAQREIQQSKEKAISEIRGEVADLVIMATEKILGESLDKDKHMKLVNQYIEKLPNN